MAVEAETSAQAEKKFYAYELCYPKSMGGAVFYVGKGSKRKAGASIADRIDEHEAQALQPLKDIKKWGRNAEKWQAIRSIWANGEQVVKRKVFFSDIEQEAYDWESMLIKKYGIENLTNKPHGGRPSSSKDYYSGVTYSPPAKLPLDEEEANQLLSSNKAGEILGVSGKTIIRMMEDGEFPGYKIGATWKFKRGEIEAYIESRKFQAKKDSSAA